MNSAGNFARRHWGGTFASRSSDRPWLDFGGGDEGDSFSLASQATVCAYLKWDDWPVTSQDYDLYLYAGEPGRNDAGDPGIRPSDAFHDRARDRIGQSDGNGGGGTRNRSARDGPPPVSEKRRRRGPV